MRVLVLNPGSSSIKLSLYESSGPGGQELTTLAEGELSGVGTNAPALTLRDAHGTELADGLGSPKAGEMREAIAAIEAALTRSPLPQPDAVGYRVVHPGPKIRGHQRVTPELLATLREAARFAPLHDPSAIELLEEMMARMPEIPHVACFDTVFHETMQAVATRYALPAELAAEGVRRYGFHGLSCESVIAALQQELGAAAPSRVVIAHLGSGASITACVDGRSVDTSMGLTPTGGIVMGTRPGDLDPGLVLYLLRRPEATVGSVEAMLNHAGGLKALGGSSDMREMEQRVDAGDADAALAVEIFARSVARAVAGMIALHGAQALVFTGGIGEHDARLRSRVVALLGIFGARLDDEANSRGLDGAAVRAVHATSSELFLLLAEAQEDRTIAHHVLLLCSASHADGLVRE